MKSLQFQTVHQLIEQIKNRTVTSAELLDAVIQQAETYNGKLNAIVTWHYDEAREKAKKYDELAEKGNFVGPLHGLPITVKDTFETKGIRTTAGSPKLVDHIPSENALAIERLEQAGAIIYGKTNTPTFAADIQTNNPVFGCTNNPWDIRRTCGGSSGGSAVSTAMGFSAFEIGSDIGGSLRIPASFCGVYTIKPSYGIIPTTGLLSTFHRNFNARDISCIGPFSRSAEDLPLLLDVLAGPTSMEAAGWQLNMPKQTKPLKDYRVAAWLDDDYCRVDNEVAAQLQTTVEKLRHEGVKIDFNARPDFTLEEATDIYVQCLAATAVGDTPDEALEQRRATIHQYPEKSKQGLAYRAVQYSLMDAKQVAKAKEAQARLRSLWQTFFKQYDILLCPVSPTAAFKHIDTNANFFETIPINGEQRDYAQMWVWIGALAGVAYLPAVSAPVGTTASGLPVGLQIIAPYMHDYSAIDFAHQLEKVSGGYEIPPMT